MPLGTNYLTFVWDIVPSSKRVITLGWGRRGRKPSYTLCRPFNLMRSSRRQESRPVRRRTSFLVLCGNFAFLVYVRRALVSLPSVSSTSTKLALSSCFANQSGNACCAEKKGGRRPFMRNWPKMRTAPRSFQCMRRSFHVVRTPRRVANVGIFVACNMHP